MSDQTFDPGGATGEQPAGADQAGSEQTASGAELDWGPIDPQLSQVAKIAEANATMAALNARMGFAVTPEDPEFHSIRWNTPDADKFLDDYGDALAAKAKRTGRLPRVKKPAVDPAQAAAKQAEAKKDSLAAELQKLQRARDVFSPENRKRRIEIEKQLDALSPPRRVW